LTRRAASLRSVPRPEIALVAVVAVALVVRMGFIAATADYEAFSDAKDFYGHAESIASGDGYPESPIAPGGGASAFRPPGYPHFLAGVFAVFGDSIDAGRIAGALLGVLATAFVYLIARRLWGGREAIAAGLVAAVFPPLVVGQTALLSEGLFLALELGLVLSVLALRESPRPVRWAVLAGVLCGLAALTRSNGALLAIPAALGAWSLQPRLSLRALAPPLVVVAFTALVMAPWALRSSLLFDRFVPTNTQTGYALSGTYNQLSRDAAENPANFDGLRMFDAHEALFARKDLTEPELESELRDEAFEFARSHPEYVVKVAALNLLRSFGFLGGHYMQSVPVHGATLNAAGFDVLRFSALALTILALAGAAVLARGGRLHWGPAFVWAVPVLMSASAILISGDTRYRSPVDPFLALLAGVALVWLWDRTRGRSRDEDRPRSHSAVDPAPS
jgi:4-amino-4-deoxy-L-arabinose transferase-like glycosyltransferase